ncbi:MAG: glutaredoxin [Pseudobacteriovorax sp.]|nr:glutaredoxin [Pseudobacteriovorax sp.]
MGEITIYTTRYCGFCNRAKMLLSQKGIEYKEIPVDGDPELRQKASDEAGGYTTVPMIFMGERFIGGFTELAQLDRDGKLVKN